jgi:hypothetical protein
MRIEPYGTYSRSPRKGQDRACLRFDLRELNGRHGWSGFRIGQALSWSKICGVRGGGSESDSLRMRLAEQPGDAESGKLI